MTPISRRSFLGAAALAAGAAANVRAAERAPVVVSSANGLRATARASELLLGGAAPLDAVIAGVNIVEEDPNDISVGYGGLPNEAGVVELDASVMDGATGGAGAVAALQGVKTPSKVARLVMERTNHVLLVGEGAHAFATAHGFAVENLLTDKSRRIWLEWLETRGQDDFWGPPHFKAEPGMGPAARDEVAPTRDDAARLARWVARHPPTGTITCLALSPRGDLAGTTTTSGLAFKLPGRVGDSPLVGCGLYVDNEVGAAGSTGVGEEVIKINGSRTVVENMRRGMKPREACLDALERIANRYRAKGRPAWDVVFYAVDRDGTHAGAAIWDVYTSPEGPKRFQYAAYDGSGNALRDCAYLFTRGGR
jgi:N4-(beta-N-acetylglucosaminyl)-L-asparaginase